jgi:hypothetical protein
MFPFIWAGMLLGISFLEAPLKFQAPKITLELGLGIGKIVFEALNRIEIILLTGIVLANIYDVAKSKITVSIIILIVILGIQTFYLLPILSERIALFQSGKTPEPSNHHFIYIALEILKLLTLLVLGLSKIKQLLIRQN